MEDNEFSKILENICSVNFRINDELIDQEEISRDLLDNFTTVAVEGLQFKEEDE